jgi:F-type H+-transporting ATPase subunit alpha
MGDVTGYIPSNVISITDGQVYLNTNYYNEGFLPAIDLGLSVSRIGHKVQCKAMKQVSTKLRLEYLQYKELLRATQLKADISEDGKKKLQRGQVLDWIFMQNKYQPFKTNAYIIVLHAFWESLLDSLTHDQIVAFMKDILPYITELNPGVISILQQPEGLTEDIKDELHAGIMKYFAENKIQTF